MAKKIIEGSDGNGEEIGDQELEHICGGKQAEIENAVEEIVKIREYEITQNGIVSDFLPLMV